MSHSHAPHGPIVSVSLDRLHQLAASPSAYVPDYYSSSSSGSMSAPEGAYQVPPDMEQPTHHGDGDGDRDDDDLDSLPSSLSSGLLSSEADSTDAQREWEESLEQIQLLLTMIVVPFAGKFLGRKFAYWSWARYMEWAHNVEIRWTNKKGAAIAGAAEVAATL